MLYRCTCCTFIPPRPCFLNSLPRCTPRHAVQSLPEVRDGDDSGADEDAAPASPSSAGSAAGSNAGGSEAAGPGDGGPLEDEFDLSDILSEEVEGEGLVGSKADRLREVEEQLKVGAGLRGEGGSGLLGRWCLGDTPRRYA